MKKLFISILTVIGIIVSGFAGVHTYSKFYNNYAYAGEFDDSQAGQNTADNQTDNSNNNGVDNSIQGISGDNSGNNNKNNNKDKTAPTVISVQPNFGTIGIPVDTTVEATFSEPVKASSVTDSTFKLENGADGTPVLADVSLSDDGNVATLTPTTALSPSASYKAAVTTGVKDLSGNKLASAETWSFTTGEGATTTTTTSTSTTTPSTNSSPASTDTALLDNGQISKQQSDIVMQSMQDDALVKRIFPLIVDKLDGDTILKKVDAQQLLEKVLPYLDVRVSVREEAVPVSTGKGGGIAVLHSQATCGQGEILVGGGFQGNTEVSSSSRGESDNTWRVQGYHPSDIYGSGNILSDLNAVAQCMKVEVDVKAPGGAPLLPP